MPYQDTGGYQTLYKQIYGNVGPGGYKWDTTNTSQKLGSMADQFGGMFQNMTGRAPTDQEMSSMFSNIGSGQVLSSPAGFSGTGYSDFQNLYNPYIQNTYGKQIQDYQQSQQKQQISGAQQQIQDLIGKQVQSTAGDLTNPSSPTYQSISGQLNNLGITPSSGAFQAGLGGTLGQAAANNMSAAMGAVTLPAISNQMQSANAPYQMSMNNMYQGLQNYGGVQSNLYDFNLQSALGEKLARDSEPSGFQKAMGAFSGASGGAGNIMQGASAMRQSKLTWICTAMWRAKVLAASEVDRLHHHLFRAFFTKIGKFLGYFLLGRIVVGLAEWVKVDWGDWRALFYDRVIAEPDCLKAVALYEQAFWSLVKEIKHRLRIKMTIIYHPGVTP